jgi:hypothetical protein
MAQPAETNSLEVRWFGTGTPPRILGEWITGFDPVSTATRTDLYLSLPDPSINLKLRDEGGEFVEFKRLLGGPRRHAFGPEVEGTLEQWYKWSFSLDHAPNLWRVDPTGLWLPVEKSRALSVLGEGRLRSLGVGPDADVTAHVEVTEVAVGSETAWTCGLEVAGDPEELEDTLDAVGGELFGEGFPLELPVAQSFGYGEWLHRRTSAVRASPDVLVPSNR